MMRQALRHARSLTAAEWVTLAGACGLHLVVRLLVARWPLDRVASFTAFRRAQRPSRVGFVRLARIVGWSARLCGGNCLTASFVLRALAARRGLDLPVVVGVRGRGPAFRAHAWAGEPDDDEFAAIWRSTTARSAPR
jgi:hypothetical protein